MDHRAIARVLLSIVCASQGLGTLAVDLNRTHATNPAWTGHARFHLVWQSITVFVLGGLEVALIWWQGPYGEERFYLAMAMAAAPMVAFLGAFAARRAYGGTLSDPNGIPSWRGVDVNLAVEVGSLLVLAAIVGIHEW